MRHRRPDGRRRQRAGVGVGTVYRHFPTKEALMVELVRQKFRLFAAGAREALERDGEPFAVFADLLRGNADELARDAGMQHVLVGVGEHIWAQAQTETRRTEHAHRRPDRPRPARRDDAPGRARHRHRDADVRPVRHDDPAPPRLRLAPPPGARDRHAPGTVTDTRSAGNARGASWLLERIGSDDDLLSAPMRRGSLDGEASSDSAWSPTLIILTKAFWTNCRYDGRGQGRKLGACWLVRRRGRGCARRRIEGFRRRSSAAPWWSFRTWASVMIRVAGDRLRLPVSGSRAYDGRSSR